MEKIRLNNNLECPVIGIGTYMLSPEEAENSVREALKTGYSLVDTANAYQNERGCREGKAKSIGISNFEGRYIDELEKKREIVPQFIQVEAHPYFTQKDLRVTLDKYGIKLMSWYPLGHGDRSLIEEPVFEDL